MKEAFEKTNPNHLTTYRVILIRLRIFFQEIEGFVFSPLKCALSSLIVVFTGGLFLILLTWRSDIKLNCLYRKVPLPLAKKILLKVRINHFFRVHRELSHAHLCVLGQVSPDFRRRCDAGKYCHRRKRIRGKEEHLAFCQQENQVCVGPKSRRE